MWSNQSIERMRGSRSDHFQFEHHWRLALNTDARRYQAGKAMTLESLFRGVLGITGLGKIRHF
jgi:hypothetical protein